MIETGISNMLSTCYIAIPQMRTVRVETQPFRSTTICGYKSWKQPLSSPVLLFGVFDPPPFSWPFRTFGIVYLGEFVSNGHLQSLEIDLFKMFKEGNHGAQSDTTNLWEMRIHGQLLFQRDSELIASCLGYPTTCQMAGVPRGARAENEGVLKYWGG